MSAKKMTAKDLIQTHGIVVEVPELTVKAVKDGFNTINADKFITDKVVLIRVNTFTKNFSQVVYFDEKQKAERAIVVPNEFLFKAANKEDTEKLMGKFKEWMLQSLFEHCRYLGSAIGSDPEIFIETEKGEILPAFDFLGSKAAPNRPVNAPGGGNNACYWDGFQAEFDTHANSCMQVHGNSIQSGLVGIYQAMKKKDPTAKLSAKTVFDIPLDLLKKSKEEHVAFGCRESLNVYGLKGTVADGRTVTYRSAGGHIHFGLGEKLAKDHPGIVKMVKALDAVLGVACVSMFAKFDDPRRRQMYGLAGEYRLPPHGFEYRTLSNAWLFHPLIAHLVFDLARSTTSFGYKDFLKHWECDEAETIRIINECDVTAARKVLKKNKKIMLQIINTRYNSFEKAEFVYDIFYGGMETVIAKPKDIEGNWSLTPGSQKYNSSPVHMSYLAGKKV